VASANSSARDAARLYPVGQIGYRIANVTTLGSETGGGENRLRQPDQIGSNCT
jgi:hypothetical protein